MWALDMDKAWSSLGGWRMCSVTAPFALSLRALERVFDQPSLWYSNQCETGADVFLHIHCLESLISNLRWDSPAENATQNKGWYCLASSPAFLCRTDGEGIQEKISRQKGNPRSGCRIVQGPYP